MAAATATIPVASISGATRLGMVFNSRRDKVMGLAARYAILAIYEHREFALPGV